MNGANPSRVTGAAADPAAALAHLRARWPGGLPPGGHLTTWAKRGRARQHADLEAAADDLCSAPSRYMACAAFRPVPSGRRGGAEDVLALAGFAIDVDCKGGQHAQEALPAADEALDLLKKCSPPASLLVASGGGFYAWLLFEQPWLIADEQERRRARRLSDAWHDGILGMALERGWILDRTSDLPRCVRCVGTLNGKYAPPRLVRQQAPADGQPITRYTVAEVESRLHEARFGDSQVARGEPWRQELTEGFRSCCDVRQGTSRAAFREQCSSTALSSARRSPSGEYL